MLVSADRARKNQIRPVGVTTASVWTHISADDGADSCHNRKWCFEVRFRAVGERALDIA